MFFFSFLSFSLLLTSPYSLKFIHQPCVQTGQTQKSLLVLLNLQKPFLFCFVFNINYSCAYRTPRSALTNWSWFPAHLSPNATKAEAARRHAGQSERAQCLHEQTADQSKSTGGGAPEPCLTGQSSFELIKEGEKTTTPEPSREMAVGQKS